MDQILLKAFLEEQEKKLEEASLTEGAAAAKLVNQVYIAISKLRTDITLAIKKQA